MNPFGVTQPPINVAAISTWNSANRRAIDDYRRGYVINANCDKCTDRATCGQCKYHARLLLKVATSQEECAELLEIIDRPSPFAAICGTYGGYRSHTSHGEEACRPCKDAQNAYQRARLHDRREGAV